MSFPLDKSQEKNQFLSARALTSVPKSLLQLLAGLSRRRQVPLFFSGGVVRDWLLEKPPADLDITVPTGALAFAAELATALSAAFVPLSPAEGVARVVWGDYCLDISQFREGTTTLEDDLERRDFSINALAVPFDNETLSLANGGLIIDPLGGVTDIIKGVVRQAYPRTFEADPLRMLRAYRFQAVFNWRIDSVTLDAITRQAALIQRVSGERIAAELDKILACGQCHPTIRDMAKSGLLFQLFPELCPGVGLLQPSSHHLDVFDHSLETLRQIERIILGPEAFFPMPPIPPGDTVQSEKEAATNLDWSQDIGTYLDSPRQTIRLKYAALLHDLGKTVTRAEKEGRITFYNHDEAGVALVDGIARRLRWSNEDSRRISQLVRQHMWPFHLHNARVRTGITPRAILKLVKAAGDDLIGLFFLVMSDSLAGQGPGKPEGMEEAVAALFNEVYLTYRHTLKPILAAPLLTGHDLIGTLHLTPGPLFRHILDELEEARANWPEMTKDEALAWARDYVAHHAEKT